MYKFKIPAYGGIGFVNKNYFYSQVTSWLKIQDRNTVQIQASNLGKITVRILSR